MIIKENSNNFDIGDLVEVTRNDDKKFECLVVEKYNGGFVSKVLNKDKGVGTANWKRYGLFRDSRFQMMSECKEIKVLSKAAKTTASSTFTLNESVTRNDLTYYETRIDNSNYAILCMCEGFGGWSFCNRESRPEGLKESFFNSQIAKTRSLRKAAIS